MYISDWLLIALIFASILLLFSIIITIVVLKMKCFNPPNLKRRKFGKILIIAGSWISFVGTFGPIVYLSEVFTYKLAHPWAERGLGLSFFGGCLLLIGFFLSIKAKNKRTEIKEEHCNKNNDIDDITLF